MVMPRQEMGRCRCCCCCACKLRNGTLIIGFSFSIISAAFCIYISINIVEIVHLEDKYELNARNKKFLVQALIFFVVMQITSFLLIVGVMKKNRWFLLPWIVFFSFSLIIYIILYFLTLNAGNLTTLVGFIGSLALSAWILKSVISYFKELGKEEQGSNLDENALDTDSVSLRPVPIIANGTEKEEV